MLELNQLSYGYTAFPLFKALTASLRSGAWLYVRGPNGAGKSTLLKIVVGLIRPQAGQITWQGKDIESGLSDYHQQLVYVSHFNGLTEALTLRENLSLDWHWHPACETRLESALLQFNLDKKLDERVANLSKGQQRKAALLRLWMTQARLWVLDEPFTALDQDAIQILTDKIHAHLLTGGQVVLTSHQPVNLPAHLQVELHL